MNPISERRKSKTKLIVDIRIRSEAPVHDSRLRGIGDKSKFSQAVSRKVMLRCPNRLALAIGGERSAGYPLVLT